MRGRRRLPEHFDRAEMNPVDRNCMSKRRHETEAAAVAFAAGRDPIFVQAVPLRAYLCPLCGFWHLTKLPKEN